MFYIFTAPQSGIPSVRVMRGMGVPKLTSGYGRWEVVDRPRRRSVTIFSGSDPATMTIPVLFEGWGQGRSIENDLNNLWRMKQIVDGEPPTVRVSGGVPRKGIPWAIQGIDEGDNAIWEYASTGTLVRFRQDAVVTLIEKVLPDIAQLGTGLPGSTHGTVNQGAKLGRYTVKEGDTLTTIAVAKYGDRRKWTLIAAANGLTDPRALIVAQDILLP